MFVKRIISCLDFYNGRIVKGVRFKNLLDIGDPISVAKYYSDQGADEIVFLDISASIEKKPQSLYYINKISSNIVVPLIVGGGIKSLNDVNNIFNSGADKISLNSFIISNPNFIKQIRLKYGSQSIICSLDIKRNYKFKNFINWELYKFSGKLNINLNIFDIIYKFIELGIGEFLITNIDNDGTNFGFDLEFFHKISKLSSVSIIVSGGMGNYNSLINILKIKNINAVLCSSILHSKKYKIFDLKRILFNNGFKVNI